MKKLVFLVVVAALAFGLLASAAWATTCSFDLIAGGGGKGKSAMDAGNVCIQKVCGDCPRICVTVYPAEGWTVKEIHVAAAADLADIPQVNGNPVPGRFEGSGCGSGPVCVPWPNYNCPTYIAVHVAMCSPCGEDETAWARAFPCGCGEWGTFPGANWATWVEF